MFTPKLGYVLLFVESPIKSAEFYSRLFNLKPIDQSPTFVLFALADGVKLGLWSRHTVEPTVKAQPGCAEICFSHENVDELFNQWGMQGVVMIQKPTDMDFGRTFVALDPDGHRIRISRMNERK